jgi:hypothetical protein
MEANRARVFSAKPAWHTGDDRVTVNSCRSASAYARRPQALATQLRDRVQLDVERDTRIVTAVLTVA